MFYNCGGRLDQAKRLCCSRRLYVTGTVDKVEILQRGRCGPDRETTSIGRMVRCREAQRDATGLREWWMQVEVGCVTYCRSLYDLVIDERILEQSRCDAKVYVCA